LIQTTVEVDPKQTFPKSHFNCQVEVAFGLFVALLPNVEGLTLTSNVHNFGAGTSPTTFEKGPKKSNNQTPMRVERGGARKMAKGISTRITLLKDISYRLHLKTRFSRVFQERFIPILRLQ